MEDSAVPREGAKGDALAASSKPTRPIASVCRNLSLHPALDTELRRIWLRADSTPGRRLEVGRVLGLAHRPQSCLSKPQCQT
ncbi:mCG3804, isoform CRA_a [Mus musculus]|nr:mCG3804, isoform CRA_a [Mus musculus]